MNICQNYCIPHSVSEALSALAKAPDEARIIAGGTDLLLDIQQGRHPPVHTLVDITQIPELTVLEIRGDQIFIGAAVTHKKISTSPIVNEHAQALATACGMIGGPQVRNTATLGGNVAHGLPAADGTIALMALGAQAEIAALDGVRRIPLGEIFLGPGRTILDPKKEILTGFYVGLRRPGESSAFNRIMRPQGVAIAILNLALWLRLEEDVLTEVRIAVGPSGPVPRRMLDTEEVLRGHPLTEERLAMACQALLGEASFRTSRHRATREYRQKMACVLLETTLKKACQGADSRIL